MQPSQHPATNVLASCGKPLFFRVANAAELGLTPPGNRIGESVRTWVRAVGGMQKEALVAASGSGAVWRLASDEGDYLKGADAAPCPLSFMTTGMVASFMKAILTKAAERDVAIRYIRLTQDNYYTMQGSALKGTMIGGALPVELAFQMDADAGEDEQIALVQEALDAAPISDLVRRTFDNLFALTHNGQPVAVGRVASLEAEPQSDGGGRFDAAAPEADAPALITKHGKSPRTSEATSSEGSSLAEEQDRRLHVRGICTLRPDGQFEVEQQLFNPHGSIFRFVVDPENERAPGPAAYISAGIAFCFMTQFGRYASIVRKPLKSYSVVQDTHFSTLGSGDGSGRGEGSGRMDAVETFVHLSTDEDENFARACLDMSEQTCFLHALCRLPLDVNLKPSQS